MFRPRQPSHPPELAMTTMMVPATADLDLLFTIRTLPTPAVSKHLEISCRIFG